MSLLRAMQGKQVKRLTNRPTVDQQVPLQCEHGLC